MVVSRGNSFHAEIGANNRDLGLENSETPPPARLKIDRSVIKVSK